MSRLTLEYDARTHKFRFLLERDAEIVAARQIDLPRLAKRLLGRLAFVAALLIMATHPLPYRHVWQPVSARGGPAIMSAEAGPSTLPTMASSPVAYHGAAKGVLPAYVTTQGDEHPVPTVANLPTPPDSPGLELWTYQAAGGETLARIAQAASVSRECIDALNPGVTLAVGARLLLPRPGCEVIVYRATGGESLSDLAAFWSTERVAAYLGPNGSPEAGAMTELWSSQEVRVFLATRPGMREVTLAQLVADNGLDPRVPLAPGQVVYVQLTRPSKELQVKSAAGWTYIGCNMGLPVAGTLSQSYGGDGRGHRAIDIAAPEGTPITCVRDGVVVEVGYDDGGLGMFVRVVHVFGEDGLPVLETIYGHCSGYNPAVGEIIPGLGTTVRQGDMIGKVGNNGNSTGSHTHFVVRVNGQPMPPLWFVAPYGGPGE